MFLDQKMFQQLAEKIIENVGYNINIIDTEGIIIASGDEKRIGKYHAIGHKAALEERRIDIHQAEEGLYSDVKFGVNQPFYYKGDLVGIIGITGSVHETSDFVKVVKTMIELMVEQEMLKENIYHRQSNKSYFANLIFNLKGEEDEIVVLTWAQRLGYRLDIARAVLLISFDETYNGEISAMMLNQIKNSSLHKKEDFSAVLSMGKLLILKSLPTKIPENYLKNYAADIYNCVRNVTTNIFIGISSVYNDVKKYKNGFEESLFIINQLKKEQKNIGIIDDYLIEYLLFNIPKGLMEHYIGESIEKLGQSKELFETIEGLTDCGMNLVETAKYLYVHRNTVIFRLGKIKKLTKLDPVRNILDRHLFQLITIYYRLYMKGSNQFDALSRT